MAYEVVSEPNSLEDWVAVKEKPFGDCNEKKKKLKFHVSWNNQESKIVMTCHDRSNRIQTQSVSNSLSFSELKARHDELSLVYPQLEIYFPRLPFEPYGLWVYICNTEPADEKLCKLICDYIQAAVTICYEDIVLSTFFLDGLYDQYYETMGEFKQRKCEEKVKEAEDRLQSIEKLRVDAVNMKTLSDVYKLEDEAVDEWHVAHADLYNYYLRPFLDERELARLKLMEAKAGLQNSDSVDRTKTDHVNSFSKWQDVYVQALDHIQELYIEYYKKTHEVVKGVYDRMLEDKDKFGQQSFRVAASERYNRAAKDSGMEHLQLLANILKHYENQRDKVKQAIASIEEKPQGVKEEVKRLEKSAYDWQLKILNKRQDILKEEDKLIKFDISIIKQEQADAEDDCCFYDAQESLDESSSGEEEEVKKKLDPRLHRLQMRRTAVNQKLAAIRTKKDALIRIQKDKYQTIKVTKETYESHHAIQKKRDEHAENLALKRKQYDEERRKTIMRLKQFNMKYPTKATLKPPRYQPPSARRAKLTDQSLPNYQSLPYNQQKTKATNSTNLSEHLRDDKSREQTVEGGGTIEEENMELEQDVNEMSPMSLPVPPSCPPPPPPPPPPPVLPPPPAASPSTATPQLCKYTTIVCQDEQRAGLDLSSIKNARSRLKTAEPSHITPNKPDAVADMMQLIKQGVKLRPVAQRTENNTPSFDHQNYLEQALMKLSKNLGSSDEESDNEEQDFED